MSLMRHLVNTYVRMVEKPRMANAEGPLQLRQSLERQAKYLFRAPRGTRRKWISLEKSGQRVEALDVSPRNLTSDGVILYFHGGGFVFGSPDTHAAMLAQLGFRLQVRAVLPRYRLAPEAAFPAAFNDVRTAWDSLLASGVTANKIVIGGDSAGGALALSLLAQLVKEGRDKPAGVFCFSPLTDLTFSGDSFRDNAAREAILPAQRATELGQMYLKGHPAADPQVSPLFADFNDAPPIWLTAGDSEILLDDSRRIADKIRAAGGDITFTEEHDLPHVWPIMHNVLPEARRSLDALTKWIRQLPGWQGES